MNAYCSWFLPSADVCYPGTISANVSCSKGFRRGLNATSVVDVSFLFSCVRTRPAQQRHPHHRGSHGGCDGWHTVAAHQLFRRSPRPTHRVQCTYRTKYTARATGEGRLISSKNMVGDLIPEVAHCVTAESLLRQDLGQPVLWTHLFTTVLPTESRTRKFLRTVKMRRYSTTLSPRWAVWLNKVSVVSHLRQNVPSSFWTHGFGSIEG